MYSVASGGLSETRLGSWGLAGYQLGLNLIVELNVELWGA